MTKNGEEEEELIEEMENKQRNQPQTPKENKQHENHEHEEIRRNNIVILVIPLEKLKDKIDEKNM